MPSLIPRPPATPAAFNGAGSNGATPNGAMPTGETPGGTRATLAMRPLPPRGDRRARLYWVFGAVAYLGLSATLAATLGYRNRQIDRNEIAQLIGLGAHRNFAVLVLVLAGAFFTVVAAIRVWRDINLMRAEEADIEWVQRTGTEGLDLVYFPEATREALFAERHAGRPVELPGPGRVETLLDERVRRVQIALASAEGGLVVPAELRGIAEVRTAAYGAFARYASSLLLLLAVLGTFAGVKTALPQLIAAVSSKTDDTTGLVNALSAVASAFGGNALALVGAVAVGLMAQGVALGRRDLLERLELISAEYLYGRNVAADANPMQSAVVALRDTAREMQSASGAMLGIEGGLDNLGGEFRGSLETFGDRLRDIVVHQETGMYDRTAASMEELQRRVADLARGVEANVQVYAGLAEAVGTRSRDTTAALDQMRQTNQQLATALEGVVAAGQQTATAFGQLRGAVLELQQGRATSDQHLAELTGAVQEMRPTFAALGDTLAAANDRLRASEDAARQGWQQVGDQLTRQLADAAEGFRSFDQRAAGALEQVQTQLQTAVATRTPTGSDPEVTRLLKELVATLGTQSLGARQGTVAPAASSWRAALVPFAATVVGAGIAAGATYSLVHPAQQEAQAAIERLEPTLDQLGTAVDRLRAQQAAATRATRTQTAASPGLTPNATTPNATTPNATTPNVPSPNATRLARPTVPPASDTVPTPTTP